MKRKTGHRTWSAAFVLLAAFIVWTAMPVGPPVLAHFCDDNYTTQQAREACWWRYWNGLSTQQDKLEAKPLPVPVQQVPTAPPSTGSPVDVRVCDVYYFEPADRANCWQRWRNGLPLFALSTSGLVLPVVPVVPAYQPSVPIQTPISIPAYQAAPVSYITFPPPRGIGSRCTDFDTRGQYEAFYAGRTKPSRHDRDRDGLYCENL